MVEFVNKYDVAIGIFISGDYTPEKTKFLTSNYEPFQCGIGVFKKDAVVEPHKHKGTPTRVSEFQEVIIIRRGRVLAEVFDEEGEVIRKLDMGPGDALLLLRGGHAFHFLEDTELLEVKQGPYQGREQMKVLLNPAADKSADAGSKRLEQSISF